MPRGNRRVKSLPRQHLEYLEELFHRVQTTGSQLCEVLEPTNYNSPQFALRCLPGFYDSDPMTRSYYHLVDLCNRYIVHIHPTSVLCPRRHVPAL